MTIVFAKLTAGEVCVVSDTMITDSVLGKSNAIPGRLKIIPVRNNLTIAYAGAADPALHDIRTVYHGMSTSSSGMVRDFLRRSTVENEFVSEFLVISHDGGPILTKIWDGRISDNLEEAFIGDPTSLPYFRENITWTGNANEDGQSLRGSFLRLFLDKGVQIHDGVGGLPISLIANKDGHKFKSHSFEANWKPIRFEDGPLQYEDENDLLTGEWNYRVAFIPAGDYTVPLAAVAIPQAKIGYIYSPLFEDDPAPISLLEKERKWTQCQKEIYDRLIAILNAQADFLKF